VEQGTKRRSRPLTFFATRWEARLARWKTPLLVLGNPPWVTSADLSLLGIDNLPDKTNLKALSGLDAITGKGNFDISEWMVLRWLELGQRRDLTLAMLIKTAVARRVLDHAHRQGLALSDVSLHRIDARASFGAAVDAVFFCFSTRREQPMRCPYSPNSRPPRPRRRSVFVTDASWPMPPPTSVRARLWVPPIPPGVRASSMTAPA